MEHKQKFIEAINACNSCILEDDRTTWYPKVVRIEGPRKILEVYGQECGIYGTDTADDSCSNALWHLVMDKTRKCAIHVYPRKCGFRPLDVLVGYMNKEKKLTLAWENDRVLPMIGNCSNNACKPTIPPDAHWIVAAAFQYEYRRAISFFSQGVDQETLKNNTSKLIL